MPRLNRIIVFLICAGALGYLGYISHLGHLGPRPARNQPVSADPTAGKVVEPGSEECTIGVASGTVTSDGRPLLWKIRDNGGARDNEVYFNDTYPHRFVAVVNADGAPDSWVWMGVNEHGLAILNANVYELGKTEPYGNGGTMREVLGKCRSVVEFVAYLDSTNGNRDTHANFGVIDSTGAAFMFEASADTYWTYDAAAAPEGFIVRANFACNDTAGFGIDGLSGDHRFLRATTIMNDLLAADSLSHPQLLARPMRDFSDYQGNPFPVPCFSCGDPDTMYGCINTWWSLCTRIAVSGAIIHGVDPAAEPAEPAFLTTLWAMLGFPPAAIAVPYWPVGPAPAAADGEGTAPLCDAARNIFEQIFVYGEDPNYLRSFQLLDGEGGGLWSVTLPTEAAFVAGTRDHMAEWRSSPPEWTTLLAWEDSLAEIALEVLLHPTAVAQNDLPAPDQRPLLGQNHPNPFNATTIVPYTVPRSARVRLAVYDARGHRVALLVDRHLEGGAYTAGWNATGLASGTYYLHLTVGDEVHTRSCAYVK